MKATTTRDSDGVEVVRKTIVQVRRGDYRFLYENGVYNFSVSMETGDLGQMREMLDHLNAFVKKVASMQEKGDL